MKFVSHIGLPDSVKVILKEWATMGIEDDNMHERNEALRNTDSRLINS